jgi:hypothetical protein
MSKLLSLRDLAVAALAVACFACGSDQKQPNTPGEAPAPVAPVSTGTVPEPEEVGSPPNGEPTDIPPSNPPPQSANEVLRGNLIAAPPRPIER